jgi:2-polyprenyl-6-methoxyphenol hydroxylase-like FAD-dependent oxidoreductase
MTENVLVVGAGPSGLVVASELALAGVDVTVLERRTDGVQSRAGTILPRVLELLDWRGHSSTAPATSGPTRCSAPICGQA